MKVILLAFLITVSLGANAQENTILVSAPWLHDHVQDPTLVILQTSYLQYDYNKEHIAGARYLWPEWLAPNSPEGNMNAPDPKKATDLLQSYGINNDSHVIVCYVRNDIAIASRMFLTLESLGLKGKVSLLNGGLEAWKKEGYAVTTEVPKVTKGKVVVHPVNVFADKEYVAKTLSTKSGEVVDARMQIYYDGEPTGNPRDGHITGAKNIPYTEMTDDKSVFKSLDQLQQYFEPVATKDKEIVTYCFIGQTASVVYVAGRLLGYDMKLYDGSLQEWSRIDTLPMEKTLKADQK